MPRQLVRREWINKDGNVTHTDEVELGTDANRHYRAAAELRTILALNDENLNAARIKRAVRILIMFFIEQFEDGEFE
jgi:hypothetical protein